MIAGREGRNLRFQRFAVGGLLALSTESLIGHHATGLIFWGVLALTMAIEIRGEIRERRQRKAAAR